MIDAGLKYKAYIVVINLSMHSCAYHRALTPQIACQVKSVSELNHLLAAPFFSLFCI